MNVLERIEARIERVPFSSCWYWMGSGNPHGYGQMWLDGRLRVVHRIAYESLFGPIPADKELNHLCETKCCCNPAHLEAVTHAENMRYSLKAGWGPNARKTHCKRGHPFLQASIAGKGRHCLICENEWRKYSRRGARFLSKLGERT